MNKPKCHIINVLDQLTTEICKALATCENLGFLYNLFPETQGAYEAASKILTELCSLEMDLRNKYLNTSGD